jgi:hypothetical protein
MNGSGAWSWRAIVLAAALALTVTNISMNTGGRREHRAETVDLQQAILRGEPGSLDGRRIYFPQFQNRVLFPMALAATVRVTGLDPIAAYAGLRLLSSWLAFWIVLHVAASLGDSPSRAAAAAVLLALALIVTFNHPWEHPTDVVDMATFALAVAWTVDHRYGRMVGLAVVASANRESSIFLSLLWAAVQAAKLGMSRRWLIEAAALFVVATAAVMGLRLAFGGTRALAGPDFPLGESLRALRAFLRHPSPFDWPVGFAVLAALCAAGLWDRPLGGEQRAIVAVAAAAATMSAIGGAAEELRIYIPAVTMTIVAGVCAGERGDDRETRQS